VERKQPETFCCTFPHAQIPLGLVVVKRNREIVQERQHLIVSEPQPLKQVADG
jgi:hypothetical protein